MRIGMPLPYAGGFAECVEQLTEFEAAGLDMVLVPEAYTFDSVSQLGYLAAKTTTVELCASVLGIYSRTPTVLAMTAAGLDFVSDGRFRLGLGASGPQVVEGFHGVKYDAPLARTREIVDICRSVWARDKLEHHGRFYDIPLTEARGGSGLGKPLKLINTPVRDRVPMMLAAIGPKSVELAAELFESWAPMFYFPERARDVFGEALSAGAAKRSNELPELDVAVYVRMMMTEDADERGKALQVVREHLALYLGGMGAPGKNFYNELAVRFGFETEAARVQQLYLSGKKAEAAAALPDELVSGVALVGAPGWVAERVAAFAEAGVTTINAVPVAENHQHRVADVARLRTFAG